MAGTAIKNVRGCGTREAGHVYLEVATSPFGKPLEHFLFDPPQPIEPDKLGIAPIGMTPLERNEAWHVGDWIGEQHYPNVCDFLIEGQRLGFSRKIASTFNFSLLNKESRILCVHKKAFIDNYVAYYRAERGLLPGRKGQNCPKALPGHLAYLELDEAADEPPPMCARLWWQDVVKGQAFDVADEERAELVRLYGEAYVNRRVSRTLPCGVTYEGYRKPDDIEPDYLPALFLWLPISRIVVIKGRDGQHHEAVKRASKSRLPVALEDE